MKSDELRPLDDLQLEEALKDTYKKLFWLKFQATTEKIESVSELKKMRRTIARIKTLQREREIKAGR
jgi:large subunit ribosomal protein L29